MSRVAIYHEIDQRTPEWYALRAGRVTASRADDVLATIKSGEAAARRNYRMDLCIERLTGRPKAEGYINADMQRGIDQEPAAIAAYEATGPFVTPIGFVSLHDLMAGCSPDGLIWDDGLLEVKCPNEANHYEYLCGERVPAKYVPQLTHALFVTGRRYADFVSYCAGFEGTKVPTLFVARLERDEKAIKAYELLLVQFLREVDEQVAEMESRWAEPAVA